MPVKLKNNTDRLVYRQAENKKREAEKSPLLPFSFSPLLL